jgi:TnpA family transposase
MDFIKTLKTPTNQVGFVLQLGYFRANGKFFTAQQFKSADINFVLKILNILPTELNFSTYIKKIPTDHRKKILELLQWQPLDLDNQEKLKAHIQWQIPQHISPKRVFYAGIEYCCHNKVELPSYHLLASFITEAYNVVENNYILEITQKLNTEQREKLDHILKPAARDETEESPLPSFTYLKKINQSLRPMDIRESAKDFELFKNYFNIFASILNDLNMSDQMTEYYATWTQKATLFQLNQFPNPYKSYLHLLCYIKHQFYVRHDLLVDILLKSSQNSLNATQKKENDSERKNKSKRNKAIHKVVDDQQSSHELIGQITAIIHSKEKVSTHEKYKRIAKLVDGHNALCSSDDKIQLIKFGVELKKIANNQYRVDGLEKASRKLQLRVSEIIKLLIFEKETSNDQLLLAIDHFMTKNGILGHDAPRDFFNKSENEMCFKENKLNISLYKILFFIHLAHGIRSGALNLLYSYRYKAIQHYMIDTKTWKNKGPELIKSAGLEDFSKVEDILSSLSEKLDDHYQTLNENYLANKNPHLIVDDKYHIVINTPKIDSSDEKYAAQLLQKAGFVPIVKVLADINAVTHFTDAFKHHSIKHHKMKPQPGMIFAGVLGKGCNMDLNHLAHSSIGIKADALNNVVNWCFSVQNIQEANNNIIHLIDKLYLATAFQHEYGQLHTSSDGRKITVAVDSILANYSFKYFGKNKGVTLYMFIDERQILFYSTVISASEREAAYVIDGLLHNNVIKSDTHSTDMHGYTELIFAVTHFIGVLNAPRLKNFSKQKLYGFKGRKTYKKMGYKILPSRGIHVKLIEEHWDDILRFMTTIKLKYTPASSLLKRLSSYAREHPLYKALKEFGRIIKSLFMLKYLDDVGFRQRIEKQLNKIEFANRFSKAIIGDHKQDLEIGAKEEQEIMTACNILIQNCVILWNYLYLSKIMVNLADPEEQKKMFANIARGFIMNWRHINFRGEFDFFKYKAANQNTFDMDKILSLKVAA